MVQTIIFGSVYLSKFLALQQNRSFR